VEKEIIQNSRVLIVDDQTANVLLIERILQQSGFTQVACLTDPREVLEQFRIFKPDLLILDLMMPRVDGYAVLTQLRGWIPDAEYFPILVVTADVSKTAKQKAFSLGAKDFLTKPIDNTEVLLRAYNLLETRWLHRQFHLQRGFLSDQVRISEGELGQILGELDRVIAEFKLPPARFDLVRKGMERIRGCLTSIGKAAQSQSLDEEFRQDGLEDADAALRA
jgi:CheY-like chemotaxis protein